MSLQIPGLFIQESQNKGRGVFTAKKIIAGDLIEICPVILLPEQEVSVIHYTRLHDYYFLWGPEEKKAAIALGWGSLYNHSEPANAYTLQDWECNELKILAQSDIEPMEEITISYNDSRGDIELWF